MPPEYPNGTTIDSERRPGELARLREEQQLLRERQDDLERVLRNRVRNPDQGKGDADEKKDEKGKDGDGKDDDPNEKKKDGKDEKDKDDDKPKPKLSERIKGQLHEHPVRTIGVTVAVVAVLVGVLMWYLHSRTYEDTDDAQIDADISAVSPRVNGTVTAVYVVDNQEVHAGDLLAELDARDLDAALAQARAGLQQAEAQLKAEKPSVPITSVTNTTTISTSDEDVATAAAELSSSERDKAKAEADLAQAEANASYAEVERGRIGRLAAIGAVTISQSDQRITAASAATANVDAAHQSVAAAQHKIEEQRAKLLSARKKAEQAKTNAPQQLEASQAQVALREASVAAAKAQLDQAELNRSYTRILAPVDGIVGKKSVNIGDRVAPGQELIALTQIHTLWVTANYRETQLRKMHPGQKTTVYVDAVDLDFTGSVESLAGATGAKYSLLPPENATGNYVKVVQRLPVRIKIDPGQPGFERLRPGMSVEPKVTLK